MEYRKVFDQIPEQFDKYRPRYSAELFADLIEYAGIGPGVSVLEIGPGTGQATDPILETGCDYHAIELGKHLSVIICGYKQPHEVGTHFLYGLMDFVHAGHFVQIPCMDGCLFAVIRIDAVIDGHIHYAAPHYRAVRRMDTVRCGPVISASDYFLAAYTTVIPCVF